MPTEKDTEQAGAVFDNALGFEVEEVPQGLGYGDENG